MASMLLALAGNAAAAAGNQKVELVLAMKEGDSTAWAEKHAASVPVTAYNKGQPLSSDSRLSEVALANVGREAHAYLYHIVHRFDTLAETTVFMPGGLPTAGFQGFAQSGASLLPGVKVEDYLAGEELLVPTMALSPDLKQFSVRMSLMDNKTETGLEAGKRFSVCSADAAAGWSPFLPNKFASSVLEPLMVQQQAKWDFGSFWARYLPNVPVPERVMAAHSGAFTVTRDNIRSHPKSYYEALLAELEGSKDPYQAFFLEHMWWYIFHAAEAPCGADVAAPESRAAASRSLAVGEHQRRRLANVITVMTPSSGDVVEFGSTVPVTFTSTHNGYYRVELWRFGNFETRLYDSLFQYAGASSTILWHVYPGPSLEDSPVNASAPASKKKTWNAVSPVTTGQWFHFYNLKPGDKYTVRVCGYSTDPNEQMCDNVFGESGEFDLEGTIDMLSPVRSNTYKPGEYVPITWQSYWVSGAVDLKVWKDGHVVFQDLATPDDGVYTFYISPDMGPGSYEVTVSKAGMSCASSGCKTFFTMLAHPPPPSAAPSPPPMPNPPPATGDAAWEVPIIQAFKGSFGLDEIKDGPGAHVPYGTTSTVAGGLNCDYVCHVYQTSNGIVGGGRRRLLFGGLQYYDAADTNAFVGCSADMIACNCCPSR